MSVEDLNDEGVADGVENLVAGLAIDDEVFCSQDGEVLGDVGLFQAKFFDQGTGGELSVAEEFEDGDAGGMGEGLEDVGFEAVGGRHAYMNITIFEYRLSGKSCRGLLKEVRSTF